MAELGVGYISIVPEVSKVSPTIAQALGQAEPAATKSGSSIGSKLASGISTTLKASAVGAGVAAGGALSVGLAKGIGRLSAIENAESKLAGLGHSTQSVSTVMNSALASVKGTAYGLGDAASVAAQMVASGIQPGQQLETVLKTVGDTASIAGRDISDMGLIFASVAARGKLQGDDMLQLMSGGVPVLQLLSKELGVTSADVSEMVSKGKIDFATFEKAMREGMGGAALEAGNTTKGSLMNVSAAAGRLGATLAGPFYDQAVGAFKGVTAGIDQLNDAAVPKVALFEKTLTGEIIPGLQRFGESGREAFAKFAGSDEAQDLLARTGVVVSDVVDSASGLAPVFVSGASALTQASAALGVSGWQLFLTSLQGVSAAAVALTPPLEAVAGFMEDHPSAVAAAVAAYAGFKTIPGIMDKISPSVTKVTSVVSTGKTGLVDFGSAVSEAYGYARQARPEMGKLGVAFQVVAGNGGVASAALDKLKGAAGGLMGLFGGPWGVALAVAGLGINAVVQANQKAEAAQEAMAAAARDSASAQTELQAAVAGTTGALNEQALAAAAKIAKGELAGLVEQGEAYSGWIRKVETDTNVWERMFNVGGQWERDKQAATEIRESYKALESAAKDLQIPMDELNSVVAKGGPEYQALVAHLRQVGGASDTAADQLEGARTTLDQMIADAQRLDPAVAQAAAGIDTLADSSSTADEKLSSLQSVLQSMGLAPKDADLAMRDAADAVDEIVEAAQNAETPIDQMGESLVAAAESGDWSHQGWRDLSRSLQDMAGDLQNVATNGGDVQGTLQLQSEALDALASQYGLTREEIDQMARSMGYVPDEITTLVNVEGASESEQSLALVWTALQNIPEGQSVEIAAPTDEARSELEKLGFKIEEIPDSDNVTITATTANAMSDLGQVISRISEIKSKEVRIKIWQEYYTSGRDESTSGTSVGQHYGATGGRYTTTGFNLPAYALGHRHGGYKLPTTGPGTETVDGFLAFNAQGIPSAHLDAGEWVVNGKSSAKYDHLINALNRDDPSVHHLAKFADGGRAGVTAQELLAFARGENVRGQQASRSLQGAPYVFGGKNWGDCSSSQGQLALFAADKPATNARYMATANQATQLAALGFTPGLGSGNVFNIGWLNGGAGGGHTSGDINGVAVEMGGGAGGQGKIGNGAVPASHPQYTHRAHLQLASSSNQESSNDEIESTSVEGYTTKAGKSVDWGEAADLYETALDYVRRTKVYDTGGIVPHLGGGINLSGKPELYLNNMQWGIFDKAVSALPVATENLVKATDELSDAMIGRESEPTALAALIGEKTARQIVSMIDFSDFGGDYIGKAKIVQDAEQGLLETRRAIAVENIEVEERERELVEARKALADAESEGGALSVAKQRKLEDAERKLNEARASGKTDKIADAERNLSRAREDAATELEKSEDKNAKAVKSALDKVNKAEDNLAESREQVADQAARVEAAERAIVGARLTAMSDLATGVTGHIQEGLGYLAGFFDEMSRLAGVVDTTRQAVSKLQIQQQTHAIDRVKALQDLQIKELDVTRARVFGAISVAEAELALEDARQKAAIMGSSSIEAMKWAIDRFRITGVFAIEDVSASVVENSALVQAAQWAVKAAEAQNALDLQKATHEQALAQLNVLQATQAQSAAAEILRLQTGQLAEQTASLYGLTANQATGASTGVAGLGGLLGGLGGIVGGVATGLAGFATAGPLGAIPGALMALQGLGTAVKGGIDAWTNKDDIADSWDGMDIGGKLSLALGLGGGAALTAGGAVLSQQLGPDAAVGGAQLGSAWMDAVLGGWTHNIGAKIDKSGRDTDDALTALQLRIDQQNADLELRRAELELGGLFDQERLQADVDYAELMQRIAQSTNTGESEALRQAADAMAQRSQELSAHSMTQVDELKKLNTTMESLAAAMRTVSADPDAIGKAVAAALISLQHSPVSGLDYENARR